MSPDYTHTDQDTRWQPSIEVDTAMPSTAPAEVLTRYQDLFAHMAEGVVFQDAEGRIVDANPAALRLLDLTLDQLQGRTSFDPRWRAIHLDGSEAPGEEHPAVVALRTGQAVKDAIFGVFLPSAERYRWLRVTAIPRLLPGSERPVGVFVTFDDITGWDYLEETARLTEARYQALLEQAVDAIFVADLDGRYIEVNPAACALLGYSRDELLTMHITDLLPAEEVPHLAAVREELLRGQTHRGEWRLRRHDGLLVPVELSARIMPDGRWQAIVRDITERKRLEGELRQAEREATIAEGQVRAVIEQAPDAILVLDAHDQIVTMNRQTELLFGYPRDVLVGQSLERLIPERFHKVHRAYHAAYMADPGIRPMGAQLDLFGRRSDGTEVPVAVSLAPLRMDGEMSVIATCRDMTERKRMEEALSEQSEQLSRTFEAMGDAVYIYDREGQLVRMNAAARALSGYDEHPELMRESARERLVRLQPRDATGYPMPPEAWPVMRVLHGEEISNLAPVELVITTPAGREVFQHITGAPFHDAEGQVMGAVMVSRDVTEQRRLERELAARAQEIERVFETDVDGVMLFDTEGHTIRMNAAQRRLLGYDAVKQQEYIAPEERARRYAFADSQGQPLPQEAWPIYRVLRGETLVGQQAVEMRFRTLDGREVEVSVSGAPIYDQEGHIVGGVTATRDVTEQRRLEQQRTDILQVVAHDLANPLTGIKLYLQAQQRSARRGQLPRLPDPDYLATMARSVERMQRLLGDMRVVVGLEANVLSIEPRPCDLTVLCQQEAQAAQLATERTIETRLPEKAVLVSADRDRLGQVLANLLSNADKYSPIERPVVLTLRVERAKPTTPGAKSKTIRQARVLIRDEGPGIPPSEQGHIWERFHRIAGVQARPGTGGSLGLGLYISHEIIERHGGTMGVESLPGQGSTFWFTLPLAPSVPRPSPHRAS